MSDPLSLDAVGQAELVRSGEISPAELVAAAIARIEAVNPRLNAVIHERSERAAAEAEGPLPDGPFRGVPMLVKNALGAVEGEPYHLGMRVLADAGWTANHDSELVRRYRAAGFVIVGSTNTPELALSATTEPVAHGPTRNPWSTDRSTGGSSGGSAAAVASGMVAVAHGNDMAGSIRIPSGWCGLFGLKPTYGRTTLAPDFNEYWGQCSHEHVLTRTVRDSAAVLDAVHGPAPGDVSPAPRPEGPYLDDVGRDPGRLRIGLRREMPFGAGAAAPACVEAAERAAEILTGLGHEVTDATAGPLGITDDVPDVAAVAGVHAASELDRIGGLLGRTLTEDDVEPWTWGLAAIGRSSTAAAYVAATHRIQSFRRELEHWRAAAGLDLLLTPTSGCEAPTIGAAGGEAELAEVMAVATPAAAFTSPFNLTGWPAASLPMHDHGGVPVGAQLAAPYGREDLLFAVAAEVETAAPWPRLRVGG